MDARIAARELGISADRFFQIADLLGLEFQVMEQSWYWVSDEQLQAVAGYLGDGFDAYEL
jgi:hypothetical protein